MPKCSPHEWSAPRPGDDFLICIKCGHASPFADLYPFKVAAILRSVQAREGEHTADLFRGALDNALADWRRRTDGRDPGKATPAPDAPQPTPQVTPAGCFLAAVFPVRFLRPGPLRSLLIPSKLHP